MNVRTYDSLWKVEKKLYSLGDIEFPMPISYTKLIFYLVGLAIMTSLTSLIGILNWDQVPFKYVLLPGIFTWVMSQIRFDGRGAYRYFYSLVRYFMRSHLIRRYQNVEVYKGYQYNCIVYRGIVSKNETYKRSIGASFAGSERI